jgi:hypothetical protein
MKNNFLIIGIPRSGTTSLMKSISSANNLPYIYEPFRFGTTIPDTKNVVVKTQLHQIDGLTFSGNVTIEHLEKCILFYIEFSKQFDTIILINRKDTKSQAESLSVHHNGIGEKEKYIYNEQVYDGKAKILYNNIELLNKYLTKLSEIIKIPIDTYEDVYYGDGLINKSILLDGEILNLKNKYRQNNTITNEKKLI